MEYPTLNDVIAWFEANDKGFPNCMTEDSEANQVQISGFVCEPVVQIILSDGDTWSESWVGSLSPHMVEAAWFSIFATLHPSGEKELIHDCNTRTRMNELMKQLNQHFFGENQ